MAPVGDVVVDPRVGKVFLAACHLGLPYIRGEERGPKGFGRARLEV